MKASTLEAIFLRHMKAETGEVMWQGKDDSLLIDAAFTPDEVLIAYDIRCSSGIGGGGMSAAKSFNPKLKRCPFCRSKIFIEIVTIEEDDIHFVQCQQCWARGPDVDEPNVFDDAARQLAADRWNKAPRA